MPASPERNPGPIQNHIDRRLIFFLRKTMHLKAQWAPPAAIRPFSPAASHSSSLSTATAPQRHRRPHQTVNASYTVAPYPAGSRPGRIQRYRQRRLVKRNRIDHALRSTSLEFCVRAIAVLKSTSGPRRGVAEASVWKKRTNALGRLTLERAARIV